jgi:hypothetical protein
MPFYIKSSSTFWGKNLRNGRICLRSERNESFFFKWRIRSKSERTFLKVKKFALKKEKLATKIGKNLYVEEFIPKKLEDTFFHER